MFQNASTLVNQRLHFDMFLPTSSRVFKVGIFQLRHSPFFTWFVLRFGQSLMGVVVSVLTS
jgi:hypothetical protein